MRRLTVLAVCALLAGGASPALGHVDVLPTEVAQGEALEFTIRVPTERPLPTTRVRVEFPSQITVFSFAAPPPGWTMRPVRGPDQRFRAVVYSGGRIPVGQYADFRLLGTPFEAGEATWKAFQTYADGQIKPWTAAPLPEGEELSETGPTDPGPAALVTVAEPGQEIGAPSATASTGDGESGAAIWLGVIAIAISAMSLLALGFLWSTRPAKLPGGDGGA
jgi:uncharacterized protein YcnI